MLPPLTLALAESDASASWHAALAQKYGREGFFAAALLVTTVLSFATTSAVLWILSTVPGWRG